MDTCLSEKELCEQQARLDRLLCQRSLYYLCKEVLGYKDMVEHIHGEFAHFWTSPIYGRFRQATLPRSFFKTWIGTVGLAIWLTLPDEEGMYKDIFPFKGCDVRILIASNVIDNAAKMIFKIKQEWMNNERLKAAFPELIPDFNKNRWSDHVAEVKRVLKATEGTYTAVGAGGSVISQHFDVLIEDDLIYARKDDFTGMELMPSQEDIDNAIGWHKLSYSLLADPGTGCIFNVGTRWAPQDIIWYIRTFEKSYNIFEIKAETDEPNPDWYGHGMPIWPERYTTEVLKHIWATQGSRIYDTQYRNMPRSEEDVRFRKEYIKIHTSFDEFPQKMEYKTVVDLAGWGDSKGICRNVILTGARDMKNNIWISRLDVGRFNPSEVINIFKAHSRQFSSRILIEEVQYQRSIRFFSHQEMEETGEFFSQDRLPFDGRKDAKNLRIIAIEPLVSNGGLHIMSSMRSLLEELELYPHSKTVDILDCVGYLYKVTRASGEQAAVNRYEDPLSFNAILKELEEKSHSSNHYPFDMQLSREPNRIFN